MNLYHIQEADFILPFQAQDLSVNAFAYTMPDPLSFTTSTASSDVSPEFSFVISRDVVDENEVTSSFASKQLQVLQQNLKGYKLLDRSEAFVDGLTAIVAEFRWQSEQELMRQKQAYLISPLLLRTEMKTGRVALTLTATAHDNVYEKYAFLLDQVLYSFTFHR